MVDEELKNVIIVCLNKTTSENPSPADFRPLSMLNILTFKNLEKMIKKRVFLPANKFSFGFRE